MKEFRVRLRSFDDVRRFVEITSAQSFHIHAVEDSMVTNAKSLIGFFSLDLSKPVTIRVEDDADTAAFLAAIAPFLA